MHKLKSTSSSASGRGMDETDRASDGNPPTASPPVVGSGLRLLIYSHDTFGLGHLQRCLKISRALMNRFPGLAILIATGSPVVHRYQLPAGVDYVKLPAVRKIGPEEYEARILATSYERIISVRTSMLSGLVQTFQPQALLVDHSPTGMKGEMLPALRWLQQSYPDCVKIIGLRDIIDDPESVHQVWTRGGVYRVLEELYDHVLVYGSKQIFDTSAEYRFPEVVRNKTTYCNYIRETPGSRNEPGQRTKRSDRKKQVVVTIGGGDGGGEIVIGNYLAMVKKYAHMIEFDSTIVTGPFLPDELAMNFERIAKSLPVTLKRFVRSTTPLFRSSDLVVSTAGYNSISQILEAGKRAIIIPRILHRNEQLIRAQRLAELGIVSMIHPEDVNADSLYSQVSAQLRSESEPLTEARRNTTVRLDGAERVVEFFERIFIKSAIQEAEHAKS